MANNVQIATAALQALTYEEMQNMVSTFNAIMKSKRAVKATTMVATIGFKHGDILSWISTRGRTRGQRYYFKFEKMNRAGTCAQGPQCSSEGIVFGGTCTVAPQFIDMANGKSVTKA